MIVLLIPFIAGILDERRIGRITQKNRTRHEQ